VLAAVLLALIGAQIIEWLIASRVTVPGWARVGDTSASAVTVRVQGQVIGDLNVRAGFLNQTGPVAGDERLVVGRGELRGPIAGSVYATGGSINVYGEVGGDVHVNGGELRLIEGSVVHGDVIVRGGTLTVVSGARVDGALRGDLARAVIEGRVGGDVDLRVWRLTISSGAIIGGDLTYESRSSASIATDSEIAGQIVRREPADRLPAGEALLWSSGALIRFLAMLALGGVLVVLVPDRMQRMAEALRFRPVATVVSGLGLALFVPLALAVLAVFVITIPVVVLGGLLYGAAAYVSMAIVGFGLGTFLLGRTGRVNRRSTELGAIALGVSILSAIRLVPIPYADLLVSNAVAIVGLGALAMGATGWSGWWIAHPEQRARSFVGGALIGIGIVILGLAAVCIAVVGAVVAVMTASGSAAFAWQVPPARLGLAALLLAAFTVLIAVQTVRALRRSGRQ
jgi:cytoskeletal protein CcmA (bactofilin family)